MSTKEAELDNRTHCRGCTCDLLSKDLVLVRLTGQLLFELRIGEWSRLLQIRVAQSQHPPYWVMELRIESGVLETASDVYDERRFGIRGSRSEK